ncbi:MAG TPA: T9SS type A sorting domain-containing protein [Candidatus Kapabacteria bacterium]|nr:T9SS type A sorting domain-containing protein [Candidatus Kapabacteria bacterium]
MKTIITLIYIVNILFFSNATFSKWEIVKSSNDIFFWGLKCLDENNCFVAGDGNNQNEYIERTSDGGLTWSQFYSDTLYMNNFPKILYGLSFPNNNLCFVTVDSGVVYKTTNLGVTWDTIYFAKNTIQTIYANNENFILREEYIYGGVKNKLFYSIDGGNNWNILQLPKEFDNYIYTRISVFGEYSVFFSLLNEDGEYVFIKTTDNGNNWEALPGFSNFGIKFYNKDVGIARIKCYETPSQFTLKITKDGGNNWALISDTSLYNKDIRSFSFFDENNIIVYFESLEFIKTTDGGLTWQKIDTTKFPLNIEKKQNSITSELVYVSNRCFYFLLNTYDNVSSTPYNIIKYTADPESVIEFDLQNEISFFPNPIKAGDNLKFKKFPLNEEYYNIKLHNSIGNIVFENKVNLSEMNEGIKIPNDISTGLYFITISGNGFMKTGKIIVND